MKTIIIFRHGKSDWKTDYGSDHSRPLAPRGINASKKMGKYLSQRNKIPDMVISSTAVRARTTAENAIQSGKWNCPLELEQGIYGGDTFFLLNLVKSQNINISSICLEGHEPNFSDFIAYATDTAHQFFPTAAMAKIDFDVQSWEEITLGFGILDWLVRPKELKD